MTSISNFPITTRHLVSLIPAAILLLGCQQNPQGSKTETVKTDDSDPVNLEIVERSHAQPVTVNYPETGVDVGWGWDSDEGNPQPNVCIEYSIEEDKGQTKYMTMTEVTDSRELMQSMNISAAASVKTIAYKASGSEKFAKNTRINSFSSNFVLNVSVDNGVRYATPLLPGSRGEIIDPETRKSLPDAGAIRLTPVALRLAKQRDLTQFLNLCGDSYVAAIYGGARLTAVITVTNSSKEEKKQASAQFSGSGWGANVKASVNESSDAKIASNRVSMRFHQLGGRKDKIPASKDDLIKKLDTLTTEASDYPAYYRITLMPYTALSNWPDKVIELDLSEQDRLADLWAQYAALYEDIEYIFEHPEKFQVLYKEVKYVPLKSGNIDTLKTVQDKVQKTLTRLRDDAIRCSMPEQPCQFDENAYLSPYAFRIQLPLPFDMADSDLCPCKDETPKGEDKINIAALVDYYVRAPVKNRCKNNPIDGDCLSNTQIDRWLNRTAKTLVELPDRMSAEKIIAVIDENREQYTWLDAIATPPHAWVDPKQLKDGETPLKTVMALLEQPPSKPESSGT
ncbi:MAG: hypothetical protein KZQ93_04680 [Candidatus Thiodiazotropha sp. (ex Monitilora ramsayi)]|nr:hypothetical protein [Candidatus Thiodiazotropha sp. (ex Monitilora ramsayi)]